MRSAVQVSTSDVYARIVSSVPLLWLRPQGPPPSAAIENGGHDRPGATGSGSAPRKLR